jgi:hypothetical protein
VAALISACQLADTSEADMSVEEVVDDWHGLDLAEEPWSCTRRTAGSLATPTGSTAS